MQQTSRLHPTFPGKQSLWTEQQIFYSLSLFWSLRSYHKSISIYLIIKESDKKLLVNLNTELRKPIISHRREDTDGFHYVSFCLTDIIDCWSKGDDDLTYEDLTAEGLQHLVYPNSGAPD